MEEGGVLALGKSVIRMDFFCHIFCESLLPNTSRLGQVGVKVEGGRRKGGRKEG